MESREDAEEEDTPRTVNDTTADTTSTPNTTADTTSTPDTTADTTSTPDTTADTTSTPDTTNTSTPDTTNTSTPNTTADTTSTPDTTNTSTPNTTADTTSTGSTVNTATDTGTAAAGGALPTSAGHTDEETVELQRQEIPVEEEPSAGAAEGAVELLSDQTPRTPAAERPAPPSNLAFSRPTKKKVLVAPALSLSLGRSESTVSEDFPPAFLSPDDDDTGPDFDLDAMETPSDSESLHFPVYELDLEDDLRRLGVATRRRAESRSGPRSRLLWRRDERHHRVCFLLPAAEQPAQLPAGDGPPVQVRGGHSGSDGVGELRHGVPVCRGPEREAAGDQLAEGVLHHHQPQAEEEPEGLLCGPSHLVHQGPRHHHQTLHQL
ncbi:mucin-2-like isoform X3 [Eleginops maclovinus]|uniref:mucin-2-like isoform X3 n=1 Tax=Eleginops maclovinus TaxID=56733 RepID=UPI0030803530